MKHAIETHRAFPIFAWLAFIGFAVFTFYLTIELQSTSSNLATRTAENVAALENTP